ncbi:MAG: TIGR02147 family protein [Fibrobacterales bacterium]
MELIYGYLDYRKYLKDRFEHLRNTDPDFSLKRINIEIKATSGGFISNVIAGRKNLTHAQIPLLSSYLNHNKSEKRYFEALLYFTRTKKREEKEHYFSIMRSLQKANIKKIPSEALCLFEKWYYVTVLNILRVHKFSGHYKELSQILIPEITVSEAKQSIAHLLDLGLIKKGGPLGYTVLDSILTTGDEVQSLYVTPYHQALLETTSKALPRIPADTRDISSITMTISENTFFKIKGELQQFRKNILNLVESDTAPNKVYNMNMQFIPVTRELNK